MFRRISSLAAVVVILDSRVGLAATESLTFGEGGRVSASSHMIVSSQKDPQDPGAEPFGKLMHEGKVSGEYGVHALDIRFSSRFGLNGQQPNPEQPIALEKKAYVAQLKNWDIALGDSHLEIGRGVALSLVAQEAFGVDNTLEGGNVQYHGGDLQVRVFGGRVNGLRAPVAVYAFENPVANRTVWLAGGSASMEVTEGGKVGLHYFTSMNHPNGRVGFDKVFHTMGGFMSNSDFLEGDFYIESNILLRDYSWAKGISVPQGSGHYASVSWVLDEWSVKWEGKEYRHYDYEFRRPPTLEEDIVVTNNTESISGMRMTVERKFADLNSSGLASLYTAYDHLQGAGVYHGVLGAKLRTESKVDFELRGGYRFVPERSNLSHLSLKAKFPTAKGQSLDFGIRKQVSNINLNFIPAEEDRNYVDLSYTFSPYVTAAVGYEFLPTNDESAGQHFINVGGAVRGQNWQARALIGQTSGGTLCSGGICRQVPPYSGAQLETTISF